MMRNFAGWMCVLCLLLPLSTAFAADDEAAAEPEVTEAETTVVCFIPGGPEPPADYLTAKMKGYADLEKAFSLKYKKSGLLRRYLSLEISFLEPAITTQVISERKGKLDWLRPSLVTDPEKQYAFSLEVTSDKKDCTRDDGLSFTVQVQTSGKVTQAPNPVFYWKKEIPKTKKSSTNDRFRPWTAGFSVSFNPQASNFYKSEGVLFTGIPFSKSVEKLVVTAKDCFGKEHRFIYNIRYSLPPQ